MKKRYSAEQIVGMLREADMDLGKGEKVPDVCRKLGITQQTYYRWRTKYGSMEPKMARQLQELQKENSRLKRQGLVLPVHINGKPVGAQQNGRLISAVGVKSGIKTGNSHASAHDFRRSFATRWSRRVRPVTLKTIMRHSDIKTTLQYYVEHDADDIARELWGIGVPNGVPHPT